MIKIFHLKSTNNLDKTAQEIFSALKVNDFKEHESIHYAEGIYFKGTLNGKAIRISKYDDIKDGGYQFSIEFYDFPEDELAEILRKIQAIHYNPVLFIG